MSKTTTAAILICLGLALCPAYAKGGGGHSHSTHARSASTHMYSSPHEHTGGHRSTYSGGAERDSRGRIARSQQAKSEFKRRNPCPSTGNSYGACPGYVIDHVQPLKRGGADAPYNMQWQTKEEARIKDRTE
jgi:hypothetical protein